MAQDASQESAGERHVIDPASAADVSFWSERLGVDEAKLRELIERVGPDVQDLRRILGEYTPGSSRR